MIGETLSLAAEIHAAIGPGIFLAAALPLSLIALFVVARVGWERVRAK